MRINVLGKLPPDFFKGLVSKNAEIYLDCLHIISNMNGGLSFKERYEDVKDEIRVYLAEAKVRIENEDDASFSSNLDKQPGEIISQMIRYGWLETDTAEGSFEKEIYVTKYAHLLYTSFLKQVDTPKKVEFSNFIISIYNLVRNRDTWIANPYYSFLKPVYQATEELSNALTEMNTYARDMIEEMMGCSSYYDITEALIRNTAAEFSEEFSRLSATNIHWFRIGRPGSPGIVDGLEEILGDPELIARMAVEYGKENHTDEIKARDNVIDMLYSVIEFMSDKYDRLYNDIQMKIEKYVDTIIGRLRLVRRMHENDNRENIAKVLEIMRIRLENGQEADDGDGFFDLYRQEIIDPDQACRTRESHTVEKQAVTHVAKISSEDRKKAAENLKKQAEDPFSLDKVCKFVEAHEKDGMMVSTDAPMPDRHGFMMILASAMYSSMLGFDYTGNPTYREESGYEVRDFILTRMEKEEQT